MSLSFLAVVCCLEIVGWRLSHRSELQLRESLLAGSPREKVWSLHILLNRGESAGIDRSQIEELLHSDEGLVREMAATSDVWRLGGRDAQARHLEQVTDQGESMRSRYYLKEMGRPVSRSTLRRYFRSLERESSASD